MSIVDITTLKTKFETGDIPTQQDFSDLIDTLSVNSILQSQIIKTNFKVDHSLSLSKNSLTSSIIDVFMDNTNVGQDTTAVFMDGVWGKGRLPYPPPTGSTISYTTSGSSGDVTTVLNDIVGAYLGWNNFGPTFVQIDYVNPIQITGFRSLLRNYDSVQTAYVVVSTDNGTTWSSSVLNINQGSSYGTTTSVLYELANPLVGVTNVKIVLNAGVNWIGIRSFIPIVQTEGDVYLYSSVEQTTNIPSFVFLEVDEVSNDTNTGDNVYYVSRDGGTNWKQVSAGVFVDLDDQPTGQNLCIKALIKSYNLNAWALAWQ